MTWFHRMKFGRGLLWASSMMLCAYLLDIHWNWRVLVLCCASFLLDNIVYFDYSLTAHRQRTDDRSPIQN